MDEQTRQRKHRDENVERDLGRRPEGGRQAKIEGREIDQERDDVGHEAGAERVTAPPHRGRADDDRVSDHDGAVGDVERSLRRIAQGQRETAQGEEQHGREYEQSARRAEQVANETRHEMGGFRECLA